jgi:hypothetical protein
LEIAANIFGIPRWAAFAGCARTEAVERHPVHLRHGLADLPIDSKSRLQCTGGGRGQRGQHGATLVVDVLANDHDADGDALTLEVTGNGCTGATIAVSGGLLRIEPGGHPSTCAIAYRITDATGRSASSQVHLVSVVLGPIFADGFERGSTSAWGLTCTTACSPEPE